MKTIIVGYGEVGKSLYNILKEHYEVEIEDPIKGYIVNPKEPCEILHICIPYSPKFIEDVRGYQNKFRPNYMVIHSTVPVGTTSLFFNTIHSPVNGIHPNLEKSLLTFTKFLGGRSASFVADYFRRAGFKVYLTDDSQTTELMKILCTTTYGLNIEITKAIKRECNKYGVPFEFWTLWVDNYNKGYTKLGMGEYVRQNLVPIMKEQGGHCTIPNTELLNNVLTLMLKRLNEDGTIDDRPDGI